MLQIILTVRGPRYSVIIAAGIVVMNCSNYGEYNRNIYSIQLLFLAWRSCHETNISRVSIICKCSVLQRQLRGSLFCSVHKWVLGQNPPRQNPPDINPRTKKVLGLHNPTQTTVLVFLSRDVQDISYSTGSQRRHPRIPDNWLNLQPNLTLCPITSI